MQPKKLRRRYLPMKLSVVRRLTSCTLFPRYGSRESLCYPGGVSAERLRFRVVARSMKMGLHLSQPQTLRTIHPFSN